MTNNQRAIVTDDAGVHIHENTYCSVYGDSGHLYENAASCVCGKHITVDIDSLPGHKDGKVGKRQTEK